MTKKENIAIPSKLNQIGCFNPKEYLLSLGFKFLGKLSEQGLMQWVEMPDGWKSEKTESGSTLYYDLRDEKDRVRAVVIIVDGPPEDSFVDMTFCTRFTYAQDLGLFSSEGICVTHVLDAEKNIFSTEPYPAPKSLPPDVAFNRANNMALDWLKSSRPKFQSPNLYWKD